MASHHQCDTWNVLSYALVSKNKLSFLCNPLIFYPAFLCQSAQTLHFLLFRFFWNRFSHLVKSVNMQ